MVFFKKRFANVTKSSYSLYYETVCYNNMLMKKWAFCKSEVDDEIYFIFNCTFNNALRKPFV